MKQAFIFVCLFLLIKTSTFSQQNITGIQPSGYAHAGQIREMPVHSVQPPTPSEIKYAIESPGYVVGLNRPVNLTVANSGEWSTVPGHKVWRLKIKSEGAEAVGLYYSRFYLPEGTHLFVYNTGLTHKSRAYTGAENPKGDAFATEAIAGDETILEYLAPDHITEAPVLDIESVSHIFRQGITILPANANQNGASAPCELNVNCSPEGDGWKAQKRSVVKLQIKSGGQTLLCSGSLINNTAQDCKNYLLTAQHCGGGVSADDLEKCVFYFNFESPGCNNLSAPEAQNADNQTVTGCIKRAASGNITNIEKSDFLLLELLTAIPMEYNVYYSGWDRTTLPAQNGVGIHHPRGDIKKIVTFPQFPYSGSWGSQPPPHTHWYISGGPTDNGHGIAEPGSSGSPLFNQNKRIVGDLGGISAALSCANPYDVCVYGKFSYSWDQAGNTAATQLKPWLDPNASGVTGIDGREACNSLPAAPTANFTGTPTSLMAGNNVTFVQTCTNSPTTFAWTLSPNTGFAFEPGFLASSPNPVIKFNTPGEYAVTLTASNTAGSDAETKTAYIKVYSNVGVEENEMAASVKIFPNPSTDLVNIRLDKVYTENIVIRVTDMMGKTVVLMVKPAGTTMIEMTTDSWARGLYQIEISSGNYITAQKFVKN